MLCAPVKDHTARHLLVPFAPYMEDGGVTEIAVNEPGTIWTLGAGVWQSHDAPKLTRHHLDHLRVALMHLNPGVDDRPSIAVVLPGGERGQIIVPPACPEDKWQMCIRKHSQVVKTLAELNAEGVFDGCRDVSFNLPDEAAITARIGATDFSRLDAVEARLLRLKAESKWIEFLVECVLGRRNIIISGATGSGKTVLSRALIGMVPSDVRVLTIEDVVELLLADHPNHTQLLYGRGKGMLTATQCIADAMRMSPGRAFLAELRGAEAWDYLRLIKSGHPGSITTVHANDALDTYTVAALLAMQNEAGRSLGHDLVTKLLHKTLDVVVYMDGWKVREIFYDPIFVKSRKA